MPWPNTPRISFVPPDFQVDVPGFAISGYIAQSLTSRDSKLARRLIVAGTGPRAEESSRDPDNVGQPTSTDPSQRIIYPSYSSLGSLRVLPIHAVKMDRSLLASAATAEADASIIAAVIGVSRRLRLRVAADGVETAEQCDFLKAHGCQEAQGPYFSAAVDPESFTLLTSSGEKMPSSV